MREFRVTLTSDEIKFVCRAVGSAPTVGLAELEARSGALVALQGAAVVDVADGFGLPAPTDYGTPEALGNVRAELDRLNVKPTTSRTGAGLPFTPRADEHFASPSTCPACAFRKSDARADFERTTMAAKP